MDLGACGSGRGLGRAVLVCLSLAEWTQQKLPEAPRLGSTWMRWGSGPRLGRVGRRGPGGRVSKTKATRVTKAARAARAARTAPIGFEARRCFKL